MREPVVLTFFSHLIFPTDHPSIHSVIMVQSTDLHRVFIQSFLSRRFMREEIALELYKRAVSIMTGKSIVFFPPPYYAGKIVGLLTLTIFQVALADLPDFDQDYRPVHAMDSQGLVSFIGEIKGQLQDFGMSIERGREDTKKGKLWWVLVRLDFILPGVSCV